MHSFLDSAGIFQVNVKLQLEEERKSVNSASPSLQRLSLLRTKNSPSFIERRRRLLSNKGSTKASSSGQSATKGNSLSITTTSASFSGAIFRTNCVPKSVEEEPHSGASTGAAAKQCLDI